MPQPVPAPPPVVTLKPAPPPAAPPPPRADPITTGSLDCQARFRRLLDLQVVNYGYNSTAAATSPERIDQLVAVAASCPTIRLEVDGHTDSIGSPSFNRALSERRAAVIVEALVLHGIEPDRLVAVGYGETRPVASNLTPEGRARNRRIEWVVDPGGEP